MYIYTRILGHEKGFPSPPPSPDFVIMAGRIFLFSPDSFPFSTPAASRNSYRLRFHFLYLRRCLPAANNADTPDTLITSSAHLVSPSLLLSRRFSPLAFRFDSPPFSLHPRNNPSLLRRNAASPHSFIPLATRTYAPVNKIYPATSTRLRNFPPPHRRLRANYPGR